MSKPGFSCDEEEFFPYERIARMMEREHARHHERKYGGPSGDAALRPDETVDVPPRRVSARKTIQENIELMKRAGHIFDEPAKKTWCHRCGKSAAKIDRRMSSLDWVPFVDPCSKLHSIATTYQGDTSFVCCADCDKRDPDPAEQCPGRPIPVRKP